MANYVREYVKEMETFLEEGGNSPDKIRDVINEHLIKISFFQHERLIHLLVTSLFAVMDIIAFAVFIVTFNFSFFVILCLFTLLLIPYIFHYYFLENSVQKMYKQYDKLKDMVN